MPSLLAVSGVRDIHHEAILHLCVAPYAVEVFVHFKRLSKTTWRNEPIKLRPEEVRLQGGAVVMAAEPFLEVIA